MDKQEARNAMNSLNVNDDTKNVSMSVSDFQHAKNRNVFGWKTD